MNLLKGKKSGITLIEALIVFAAAVGLIAGALTLYGNLQNTSKVKAETSNISSIVKRMNEVFSRDALTGLINEQFIKAGVYPNSMKIVGFGDEAVKNAWDGQALVEVTGPSSWKLTYKDVATGDSCIDLVSATRSMGFDRITVGTGSHETSDLLVSDIITDCDATGAGVNYLTIVWENT